MVIKIIIGLTGQKGAGKDTVAAYLIKTHGFERKAFADPLKRSVAAMFGIPFHSIDSWKNNEFISVKILNCDGIMASLTFREFLQRFGTEAHRDVFGENFWLDYTLPMDGHYVGRKLAITDARFANEAKRVRAVGGHIVEVKRPGLSEQDQHRSEDGLPEELIDAHILNEGAVDQLYEQIETILSLFGNQDYRLHVAE